MIYTARKDDKTFMFDLMGNKIIDKAYESIDVYTSNNFIRVKNNGVYGILDMEGNEIFPIEYDGIYYKSYTKNFNLKKNGKTLIKDINAKSLFGSEYTDIIEIDNSIFIVEKKGKYGLLDGHNTELTPFIFDAIQNSFDDGLIIGVQNGKTGIFNPITDTFIVKPAFTEIIRLKSNVYLLTKDSSKEILYTLSNKRINVSQYDEINKNSYYDGLTVKTNNLEGVINIDTGDLIVPTKYKIVDKNEHYIAGYSPTISNAFDLYNVKGNLIMANAKFNSIH